ncbi:MAG: T9SS type A sorting domain-containing protein [Crocinitomix sp.]|nr:T9SS type A sorting domain-containing protein [Crocinitomix sp.]
MRYLFFTSLCLLAFFTSAQDYQTFRSDDVHYFRENSIGYMLASQIVSFEVIDGDTIMYPFRSTRTSDFGYIRNYPSWMGEKIIMQEDGINLFFNSALDTITIDTRADLGDSFTFYIFESGNTVEATVISLTEETILGSLDSVKTYEINSDEPGFIFNMQEFKLGKASGLIELYPFYSFPYGYGPFEAEEYHLVGQLYPRLGITKPTHADVNDIEIGDVVNHISRRFFNGYGFTNTRRNTILAKAYFEPDSVKYSLEVYLKHNYSGTSEEDPGYTTYSLDTISSKTYSVSDNFILPLLIPEKDYGGGETDMIFTLTYNESCGYKEFRDTRGTSPLIEDEEVLGYFELPKKTWTNLSYSLDENYYSYIEDLGIANYDSSRFRNTLMHNGVICGNSAFLNIESVIEPVEFLIYPNPTSDNLHIQSYEFFTYAIYNIEGKMILTGDNVQGELTIDTTPFQNGLYIIQLTTNNAITTRKFIKN